MLNVNNPYVFFGISGLVMAYLIFLMIHKYLGDRSGSNNGGTEL